MTTRLRIAKYRERAYPYIAGVGAAVLTALFAKDVYAFAAHSKIDAKALFWASSTSRP
jgi:hypothetical protein